MTGTAADYIQGRAGLMACSQTYERLRRPSVPDPYNPDSTVPGGWDQAVSITVHGVLASKSSLEQPDPVRSEAISTAVLILDDPDADMRRGDRIKAADGRLWDVQGYPHADINPFTGWRPTLACDLQEVTG
ncbi:MAG: hypothetical protein [Caudoviricetes sp.]|nr:MAG: hypothetical protein [Caudoviricetes sp.]